MATHICLSMFFFYVTFLHLIFTLADDQSDNYIIHMDLSAMPKPFSSQHTWYLSTLSSALENPQELTTNNLNQSLISSKLIYTYTHVINGFSASLSPKEHETLKNSPGYISSIRDLHTKLDTTHSPQFLGLNPYKGAWHDSKFGKDVIVGLVDTGVWPESESFNDNGMTEIPSHWKGKCEFEKNSSLCNKKLIGARFFNKGLLSKYSNITLGLNSTRDSEGHGTHTSTTATGSQVDNASYFGYASGKASGIASSSRVAMYKALWEGSTLSSDVIAAIDIAILDGVDVLSLSFGFSNTPLYEDPVAIATFAAMEKGVFVSTSAGNDGPSSKTLHNGIPWVITVAAGKMDREFHATLMLGNGIKILGLSLYIGGFTSNHVPIVFMGLCDNVKELNKVKKNIVVCEDKNGSIFYQLIHLEEAKVFGAVFISNTTAIEYSILNTYASIIINPINGEIVKSYIKNNSNSKSTSTASMSFKKTSFGAKPAPSVDYYSSRGPSKSCPFVLKPDITAPGTLILAAWPTNTPVSYFGLNDEVYNNFNLLSGTSMACPHVAGVAALLKGAHSDWSPAIIRSAIMTTSDIFDNTNEPIKDIGKGNNAATPLSLGAGHVNPNRALDPGLVYDVGVQDYVNLLCALNFTQQNIATITRSSSNDCSKPSLDLNYPSFIAFFNTKNSSSTQEFHRTVTNVGEGQTVYVANITPIKGLRVSVIPNKLIFNEKNEKLNFKLRIEVPKMTKVKKVAFGYLTWMDVKHVVRSPIVVTTIKFKF